MSYCKPMTKAPIGENSLRGDKELILDVNKMLGLFNRYIPWIFEQKKIEEKKALIWLAGIQAWNDKGSSLRDTRSVLNARSFRVSRATKVLPNGKFVIHKFPSTPIAWALLA